MFLSSVILSDMLAYVVYILYKPRFNWCINEKSNSLVYHLPYYLILFCSILYVVLWSICILFYIFNLHNEKSNLFKSSIYQLFIILYISVFHIPYITWLYGCVHMYDISRATETCLWIYCYIYLALQLRDNQTIFRIGVEAIPPISTQDMLPIRCFILFLLGKENQAHLLFIKILQ